MQLSNPLLALIATLTMGAMAPGAAGITDIKPLAYNNSINKANANDPNADPSGPLRHTIQLSEDGSWSVTMGSDISASSSDPAGSDSAAQQHAQQHGEQEPNPSMPHIHAQIGHLDF
jgi:hypothetical protein